MPRTTPLDRERANPQRSAPPQSAVAHPLDEFYKRAKLPLPPLQQIDSEEMPEPYKTLLVHRSDMTSTLEGFHKDTIRVDVLSRNHVDDHYFREVVLRTEKLGKPVEFGAIKIHLALFPDAARREILAERWPLGRILKECALKYNSWPSAFLKVASDHFIDAALDLKGAQILYGRCNTLLNEQQRPLAEIVEILPPSESED